MRLVAPWYRVVCPFCFERFPLADSARRDTAPTAAREEDQALGRFLAIPPPELAPVEGPSPASFMRRLGRRFVVADDRSGRYRKVCPACHMPLPHKTASGELSSEVIAIIGTRNSGKSNFFGVLLHALERRYAGEVGFRIFDQETFSVRELKPVSSRKLYRERYGKRLFAEVEGDRRAVDQTASAQASADTRIPLIYRLEFHRAPGERLLHPLSPVKALDLVIFDAAGEDTGDEALLERYILRASGIIFIIDPFQYPGIRAKLPPNLQAQLPLVENDPAEIVARVINVFEKRAGLRAGQHISVPVAFALAKSDLLQELVHPSSLLLREERHAGGFNLTECQRLSAEVMECIREWDSPQLVDLARSSFASHSFFAVSALGQMPEADLRIRSVSPIRIADPLLWLLWRRGYIRALPERRTGAP